MNDLTSALGANGRSYEEMALKIVCLVDASGTSIEVAVISLRLAQLILDARERDAWDAFGKAEFSLTADAQEVLHGSQA